MTRPATAASEQVAALRKLQSTLTKVLVTVAVVALAFTATNVTLFAREHGISVSIAWLLDPMVAVALGTVLIVDGRLSEHGVQPSGWASALRWFAGSGTWLMNCWDSLWPAGSPFGAPRHVDPAGLVLHSIPPVLLIVLAEAISFYRRAILARIAVLNVQDREPGQPAPAVPPTPAARAEGKSKSAPRKNPGKTHGKPASGRRSLDDLVTEARVLTAGWADGELTADRLRTALHCGQAQARQVRDALKADRTTTTDPGPQPHPLPANDPAPVVEASAAVEGVAA